MKTRIFSVCLYACAFFFIPGCNMIGSYERGNGNIITSTLQTGPFDRISLGGNFEVTLRKGTQEEVTMTTDENLAQLIEINVNDGELDVTTRKKLISGNKIKIEIVYNYIKEIRVYGATLLKNEELLESDQLTLRLEGAGVIDLQLKTATLVAKLSGAGLVKFKGYAPEADISLSGAGGLEAYDLETLKCNIDVSGIGSAKINVKEELEASIAGVGGIRYIGHPEKVHKNVSGVGSISEDSSVHDESVI